MMRRHDWHASSQRFQNHGWKAFCPHARHYQPTVLTEAFQQTFPRLQAQKFDFLMCQSLLFQSSNEWTVAYDIKGFSSGPTIQQPVEALLPAKASDKDPILSWGHVVTRGMHKVWNDFNRPAQRR